MPPDLNHYRVLGVSRRASFEQIRAAYVALLKRHHPDSSTNAAEHQNGVHVHRIVTAYNILKDPKRRAAYDVGLRQDVSRPRLAPSPYVPPPRRRRRGRWKIDVNALTYLVAAVAAAIGIQLLVWGYARFQRASLADSQVAQSLVRKLDNVPTPARLETVAKLAGTMSGADATNFSSHCFSQAGRSSNPTVADMCVGFDTAYVYWREAVDGAFIAEPYFQIEATKSRDARAYSRLDPDAAMIRIASIRAATFQALLRVTSGPGPVERTNLSATVDPEPTPE